ncbi:DinB family protein [Aquibacillus kalidii]|uniref:DinB family protein n=1 Tax=Aquibacillus kalidii TaxID=2762597 RepID=UPI0016473D66|nr:DinB family protein [Aquibacillus kalidii]
MVTYEVVAKEGFTEKIGELVFQLEHVREVTIQEISDLKVQELDHLNYINDNSIGALLLHIAAIEKVHQLISFKERDFNKEEYSIWEAAIELGDKGRNQIHSLSVPHYIEKLQQVRADTLQHLKQKDDEWLMEKREWPNGIAYNNFYLWFHVLEDEINHRGQIRAIKRQLRTDLSK